MTNIKITESKQMYLWNVCAEHEHFLKLGIGILYKSSFNSN